VNKFKGSLDFFSDGASIPEELSGIPVIGVILPVKQR